jgi:hypothetical protein
MYINGSEVGVTESAAGVGTRSDDDGDALFIGNSSTGIRTFDGCITEVSMWNDTFTQAEVKELYNDGKALDALTHSAAANIKGYWRNNGSSTWTDLSTYSNNGTVNNITETLLIPSGVDVSRDSQGFLMNKQRDTSSLNFETAHTVITTSEDSYVEINDNSTLDFGTGNFSLECWVKAIYRGRGSVYNTIFSLGGGISDSDSAGIGVHTSTKLGFAIGGNSIWANATFTEGNWYHVVGVREGTGSNEVKLYINGAVQTQTTTFSGSVTNEHNPGIGLDTSPSRRYEGAVDSVRAYSDALSGPEVLRNYNATKGSHRN